VSSNLTAIDLSDGDRFLVGRTSEEHTHVLGPVRFHFTTSNASFSKALEVDEACAVIAAMQVAVDDVEREGREAFDSHIEGKIPKFITMSSVGVSTHGC
jgi:hypothetical protein